MFLVFFSYPGEGRPIAFLRRWVIGSVFAGSLVWAASTNWIGQIFFKIIVEFIESKINLGDYQRIIHNNTVQIICTGVVIGIFFSLIGFVKAVEFHLFPWFDKETLRPVTRATGLLLWHLPKNGRVRDVWNSLERWATTDLHDGRWGWHWGKRLPNGQGFRCAVLLGPNGVGKSQLVRELARRLAKRHKRRWFGARLAAWWRRFFLWSARSDDDPWDVGEIDLRNDWETRLSGWLPRAPTLLVLDDPTLTQAGTAMDILKKREAKFWYPVRLIIVDQFVPLLLVPLDGSEDSPYAVKKYKDDEEEIRLVKLGDIRWSAQDFADAGARGFWDKDKTGKPVERRTDWRRIFLNVESLEPLCHALDGSPLLLAEAARWLAVSPDRSIGQLLQVDDLKAWEEEFFEKSDYGTGLKSLVGHRIARDRAKELFDSHREYEKQENLSMDALVKTVVLASIAGTIPISMAEELQAINLSDFPTLLPIDGENIAAPGAWPIAEAYVRYAQRQRQLDLSVQLGQALKANLPGTLKGLKRKGWLAGEIVRALEAMPDKPDDPALQRDLFTALAFRALRVSRDAVAGAVRRLDALAETDLAEAQARLAFHGAVLADDGVPDGVVALALLLRLGLRRFAAPNFDDAAWRDFAALFKTWMARTQYDLQYVPAAILVPLKEAFRRLCAAWIDAIWRLDDPAAFLRQAEEFHEMVESLFANPLIFEIEAILSAADAPGHEAAAPEDIRLVYKNLWRAYSYFWRLDDAALRTIQMLVADAEAILSARHAAEEDASRPALLRARGAALIVRAHSILEEHRIHAEAMAGAVDAIAVPFPDHAGIQRERAEAWRHVAYAWSEMPEQRAAAEAAARRVDAIAAPFPDHAGIQEERAGAWRYVAYARCQMPEQRAETEAAARRVDDIAVPFPDHAVIQRDRAIAWRLVAYARGQMPEQRAAAEAAAREVDAIAVPFPDHAGIQERRAEAWRYVAYARCLMPEQRAAAEAAARRVDAIAVPFPDHAGIQEERAMAWRLVAYAWSEMPEQRAAAEAAAREVDGIAVPFPDHAGIQRERADAWRNVAYARSQMPEQRAAAEAAAWTVYGIAARFPNHPGIQAEREEAWRIVKSLAPPGHHPGAGD